MAKKKSCYASMEKNAQDKHSLKTARTPGQMTLPQQISMAASPMGPAIRDGAAGSGAASSGDGMPSGSGAAGSGHGNNAKESTTGRSRSRSRSRTRSPFSAEVLQALDKVGQQLQNFSLDPAAPPPTADPPAPGAGAVQPPLPPPSQPPSPRAAEAESVAAEQAASGSGTATSGGITGPTGNARESTPASGNAGESTRELCSQCHKFVPSSCSEKPELDSCPCPRCPMCWDRISKDQGDVETLDCMHVSWLGHNASTQ